MVYMILLVKGHLSGCGLHGYSLDSFPFLVVCNIFVLFQVVCSFIFLFLYFCIL